MKRTLLFAGMLSTGFTYAQLGNVGINNILPQATLDVDVSKSNLTGTTNEGILAPRLSKVRIANIAEPKQGTLVYVLDENTNDYPNALISAYTPGTNTVVDNRVAKITEKGYYFYNGTEWIKVQSQDTNDAEWVYDDNTKRINLKRSGQSTGFVNKVYYDEKGGYINIDAEKYKRFSIGASQNKEVLLGELGYNKTLKLSKNIEGFNNSSNTAHFKILESNIMVVDENEPTSNTAFYGRDMVLVTTPEDTKSHNQLYGSDTTVQMAGSGSVDYAIGSTSSSQVINSEIKGYMASAVSDVYTYTPKSIRESYGIMTRSFLYGSGNIDELVGTKTVLQPQGGSSSNIKNAIAQDISTIFMKSSGTNIETLYGIRYGGISSLGENNTSSIKKAYGLFIGDIKGASETNYSIYTNVGKVRVGDLANASTTIDRVVTVDADGVLKTGGAITSNNGVQNQSAMACTAENAGKINYTTKQVDGEEKGVFGFCMQKGNTYVWAYMIGGSNIYGTSADGATFGDGLE